MSVSGGEPQAVWTRVDAFIAEHLAADDAPLAAALERSRRDGLPDIAVSPAQGRLLRVLALAVRAERVLEIGTLGGYSTLHLVRGLAEGGRVTTLELDARHAATARANFAAAGVADRVDLRVGPALETLPRLAAEGGPPFDLVFIDANKPDNVAYLDWALRLTRAGSLILVDNVVRRGRLLDADGDASVQGVRALFARVAAEPRLVSTAVQTVGDKGYDGFLAATVASAP